MSTVPFTLFFFFFQAEDGIRDLIVTGVQTCALPISADARWHARGVPRDGAGGSQRRCRAGAHPPRVGRLLAPPPPQARGAALKLEACDDRLRRLKFQAKGVPDGQ